MPEILTFRYKRFDGTDCYLDSSGEARDYGGEAVDIFISDDSDINRADAASLISIMISSERSNNRKTFAKLVPCSTVNLSVCMPTWTLAELKHIAPPNMTDDVMNLRYQVFGGSARNFISCPDFSDDPDGSFPFVCDILNWFLAEDIIMLDTNDQSRDVRCVVEHIKTELSKHTQGQVEGVNMFSSLMWHTDNGREFFWASRVMEMIGCCILQKKENSLSSLLSQAIGQSGVGSCIEYFGHRNLLHRTGNIKMRRMGSGNKGDNELKLTDVVSMQKFDGIDAIGSLPNNVYGIPVTCTFPVIDAIIQPDTMLQYTIADDHEGIPATLDLIRRQLRQSDPRKHRFVFVVPASMVKTFKHQKGLGNVPQFVCTYEISTRLADNEV